MVDRPTFVDIGPHRYRIEWEQAAIDRRRADAHEPRMDGEIDYSRQTITVDPDCSVSYQQQVLLHEILHGVWDITGGNHFPKGVTADEVLNRTDAALLDVLQRNPHVVEWLLHKPTPTPTLDPVTR